MRYEEVGLILFLTEIAIFPLRLLIFKYIGMSFYALDLSIQ